MINDLEQNLQFGDFSVCVFEVKGIAKWEAVGRESMNNPLSQEEPVRKEVVFTLADARPIKKIRIKFVNAGVLQEWHPGAGYPSYFFLDEVRLD